MFCLVGIWGSLALDLGCLGALAPLALDNITLDHTTLRNNRSKTNPPCIYGSMGLWVYGSSIIYPLQDQVRDNACSMKSHSLSHRNPEQAYVLSPCADCVSLNEDLRLAFPVLPSYVP